MANHKSALKRVATTAKKNLNNRVVSSRAKTVVKKFDAVVETGDKEAVASVYAEAVSTVDKAAAKGVIHKNAANRKKAQLAKKLAATSK
ncbi:MAG TPA: 30S ribosomal protein S20 [Clostridia bacterium]|nr:MAG: 30S ribosomal protein S20 [Firmicutes bacterium ADurb.Bin248]HOF99501.1 30S ribosomal protein S20 [Clostridia bacterium]HOS19147.1 30S ribosomal protein S20 [Clostridia bacterium]HPK15039.1 30S ribosomal protein S20 [Clostridia bacterium]